MVRRGKIETPVLVSYNTEHMAQAIALSAPSRVAPGAYPRATMRPAFWRAYPRETLGLGLFGLVALSAIAATAVTPAGTGRAEAAPPAPPPLIMRQIAPEQALKVNAEIPVANGPNPVASPFAFKGNGASRTQALSCLASAVYYEAGNQDAMAPARLRKLCSIAYATPPSRRASVVCVRGSTRATGCQFTFTCDGSLNRLARRRGLASRHADCAGRSQRRSLLPVGWATHYHADYVSCPIGLRPWPRMPSSAHTSFTGGVAAGGSRRRSRAHTSAANRMRPRFKSRRSPCRTSSPIYAKSACRRNQGDPGVPRR